MSGQTYTFRGRQLTANEVYDMLSDIEDRIDHNFFAHFCTVHCDEYTADTNISTAYYNLSTGDVIEKLAQQTTFDGIKQVIRENTFDSSSEEEVRNLGSAIVYRKFVHALFKYIKRIGGIERFTDRLRNVLSLFSIHAELVELESSIDNQSDSSSDESDTESPIPICEALQGE